MPPEPGSTPERATALPFLRRIMAPDERQAIAGARQLAEIHGYEVAYVDRVDPDQEAPEGWWSTWRVLLGVRRR